MEWGNLNENVKDNTNYVEREKVFINDMTFNHGNIDALMKENSQKKRRAIE